MAGTVASERQLTGIVNLDDRFHAARSADRLSSRDPLPPFDRSSATAAMQRGAASFPRLPSLIFSQSPSRRRRHCNSASASACDRHRHSISRLARSNTDCGSVMPSSRAVLRLMTNSSTDGLSTGRSPARVPLRILAAYGKRAVIPS
jgi:hypothetical protein